MKKKLREGVYSKYEQNPSGLLLLDLVGGLSIDLQKYCDRIAGTTIVLDKSKGL